jgi:hypothetical protein
MTSYALGAGGDYVAFTPVFGGSVSGTLADRSTGRAIEFCPGLGKRREALALHSNAQQQDV